MINGGIYMKPKQKSGILLIIMILFIPFTYLFTVNPLLNSSDTNINSPLTNLDQSWDPKDLISGSGDNITIDLFCENETSYSNFLIQNSFLDFAQNRTLDLPSIPGYKIYKVNVTIDDTKKITAVNDYYYTTLNTDNSTEIEGPPLPNFEAAGQEFSVPYRCYFNNASIYMAISGLVSGNNGSFQLRNNSATGTILDSQVIPVQFIGVPVWHNFTYNMILNESGHPYEVIINGSNLGAARQYFWYHPPNHPVLYFDADVKIWTLGFSDAMYNFTLIFNHLPLNETGTAPRNFTADEISLKINNTLVGNDNTILLEQDGITHLEFSTNISCQINEMNVRLYYIRENQDAQTSYNAMVNQATINWNVTINIPFVQNAINGTHGINITLPSDWVVQTVLNGSPLTEYDSSNWVQSNDIVTIKNASSGSNPWILNCTAPNYINQITVEKWIAPLTYVNITSNPIVNITETIRISGSLLSSVINTGDGNLTIFDPSDVANYSQVEDLLAPTSGLLSFNDWVISNNATSNGTYTIQVLWYNGTEVGLRNILLEIIHHTDSVLYIEDQVQTGDPSLPWFTGIDNIINVTIFYNRTFQTTGISTPNATYNIVNETGGEWLSWTDMEKETLGTGFYNVSLNVTTWINGRYFIGINLNLSGYLTQTRNITINLVYNTSITLIEPSPSILSTYYPENLTIVLDYTRIGVGIIPDAFVNYTVNGSSPQPIAFNGTLYTIQLNSTDYGVGNYNVTITASKFGHFTRQVNIDWTITRAATNVTVYINASRSANEFEYGDWMKLTVFYNDTSPAHNWPIVNALVNVTVQGDPTPKTLTDEGNGNYSITLNSSSRPAGLWNLSFLIQKPNYQNHTPSLELYARYNTTLTWIIAPPGVIRPGETLTISVLLNRTGSGPLAGQTILFFFDTNLGTFNETVDTNALGIASSQKIIPADWSTLYIRVQYETNTTDFESLIASTPVTIQPGGILEQYWWVFVLIAALVVVMGMAVRSRRKAKVAKEIAKKEILTSFQDVTKILHLVVIHKGTGADIFDYRIQERLDPTLLAGFIQAVKDFGRQLDQEGM